MSRRRDEMGWTRAENDVAEVMIWLRGNHGRELSYADIAAVVGIKDGARLRRAVKVARVVAANRGDRLERFLPSQSPARRRVFDRYLGYSSVLAGQPLEGLSGTSGK